jgi:hypothetical protein
MTRTIAILTITLLITGTVAAVGPGGGFADHPAVLEAMPIESLNDAETRALLYMVEEEKLARDVYLELYQRWDVPIFTNIADSEQHHIDSVLSLVERYDLTAPATMDTPGVFEDDGLQSLYNDLVESGSTSVAAAFRVGATIEDVDLADLHDELTEIDNEDITMVFENLISGSENHMRAFIRQLERLGIEYTPQYIDTEYFHAILDGDTLRNSPRNASPRRR